MGRNVGLNNPKSGKDVEAVYVPGKVADRLKEHIRDKGIEADERIFPITHLATRVIVKRAGNLVGINLKPHKNGGYPIFPLSRKKKTGTLLTPVK